MNQKFFSNSLLKLFIFSLIFTFSCSDDETDPVTVSAVTNLTVTDIGDFGDGRDLEISFTSNNDPENVQEYRIIVVKSADQASFDLTAANAVTSYSFVQSDAANLIVNLTSDALDKDGALIQSDAPYKVFVLTVAKADLGMENALSSSSSEIALDLPGAAMIANLEVSDVANKGNEKDFSVKFDRASKENTVSEYRIFVVKSSQAASFDLTAAETVAAGNYISLTPNGTNYSSTLPEGTTDKDGDAIAEGTAYKVFVLSVADGTIVTDNSLTNGSDDITLENVGMVTTIMTNSPGIDDVSIDADGNIYYSEIDVFANNQGSGTKVYTISEDGSKSVYASGFAGPLGNDWDADGNLYVANWNTKEISKISPNKTKTTLATVGGNPSGVTVDADGNVYVANFALNVINKITPDGTVTNYAQHTNLKGVVGIDFDENGNLYAANYETGIISKITTSGVVSQIATISGPAGFTIGYIAYGGGNLYATGIGGHKVYKVTLFGQVTELSGSGSRGSADGRLSEATFNEPNGIQVSADGEIIYMSDFGSGNSSIRKILLPR